MKSDADDQAYFLLVTEKPKRSRKWTTIIKWGLISTPFIVVFIVWLFQDPDSVLFKDSKNGKNPDFCTCNWKNKNYFFCYNMPHFPYSRGTRFSCRFSEQLEFLNLLDEQNPADNKTQNSNFPTLVTAFSESYFVKGLNMVILKHSFIQIIIVFR